MKLIVRNYRSRRGEIDLIMSDGPLLSFVEVRMRNNGSFGSGADSVDRHKQRKIILTAQAFLQRQVNSPWQEYRFDVISIGDDIDWIKNAFTLD
jgi:putative endonuclease